MDDNEIEKKAEPIDAQDGEDFTKELASRDDYGEESLRGDPSAAYHDYLGDSANFSGFPQPVNQQEIWNRFKDYVNKKKENLHEDKNKVGKEHMEEIGEGYWDKKTPYIATDTPAQFMAMPAMKIGKLDVEADEQQPTPPSEPTPDLGGSVMGEPPAAEENRKKEPPVELPAKNFEPPQEKIMDADKFWSSAGNQATVHIANLPKPKNIGDETLFTGNVSFSAFSSLGGATLAGKVKAVRGGNGKECVSLILETDELMTLVMNIAQKYVDSKSRDEDVVMRDVQEGLPLIFRKIFETIKAKRNDLVWSTGPAKENADEYSPLVTYLPEGGIAKAFGKSLREAPAPKPGESAKTVPYPTEELHARKPLEGKDAQGLMNAIRAQEKVLLGGNSSEHLEKPHYLKDNNIIRQFVIKIPEDKFHKREEGMFAFLKMSEVEKISPEAAALIKASDGEGTDGESFHFFYVPKKGDMEDDTVAIENKLLTNKYILSKVQNIYKRFGGGTPQQLFKAIAGDLDLSPSAVAVWFIELFDKLTPTVREKAKKATGIGMEKLAYPTDAWAGPTLEQVGALVGPDKAMLASEWASSLADKLNYTSYPPTFPTLVGGPSDLKKLGALGLTDEQVERRNRIIEKYREPATEMLHSLVTNIYDSDVAGGGANAGPLNPEAEEIGQLAEDVLLEMFEELPTTIADEDFYKELKSRLFTTQKMIERHHNKKMPSNKSKFTDVMNTPTVPLDTGEIEDPINYLSATLHKKALQIDDAVQISPEFPRREFAGRMGKVCDIKGDIYMCPEHGPEPLIHYLIDIGDGETHREGTLTWVVDGEFMPAGSTN